MMRSLVSRFYTLIGPITVAAAVAVSGSTESRANDVPSLQRENGPYMVIARTFRGPEAEMRAKALTSELRQENKLPAYLYRLPKGNGGIEAFAVLVGDARTLKESESVLKQVRAISPRCLADMPNLRQQDLARAYRTTNPLLPKGGLPIKRR
jgi:hypothetical protein